MNYHTDNSDLHWSGTLYYREKGASTSDHMIGKTYPFHQPTKQT